jgi:hypothetical protein
MCVLGVMVSPGFCQEADGILANVIEAQGGRELLASLKDSTAVAAMELVGMGMSGTGTMYVKEPNMMRLDLEFMGMFMTQAFDGAVAWATNPETGADQEAPEELARIVRYSSYGNSAWLNPEKYGISYRYKGKETIEGKEYYLLDRVFSDGYTITFFIDMDTSLIYKMEFVVLTVTETSYNSGLEDSFFKMRD